MDKLKFDKERDKKGQFIEGNLLLIMGNRKQIEPESQEKPS